jgi:hypothetical protein
MKSLIFKNMATPNYIFNPIIFADLADYMKKVGLRKGSAHDRHYMQHRGQDGYTRIRQTKSNIIVEWIE